MIDHINILRRQEETTYKCSDYLDLRYQSQQRSGFANRTSFSSSSSLGGAASSAGTDCTGTSTIMRMSETWRSKICEWTYKVIDYFNYDRELAFICMNYLDRYVMERPQLNTKTYQLAAITSLFLVVKTFQPRSSALELSISSLVKLSQSAFDEDSIIAMEQEMLHTLRWHLFPPTPYTFAKYLSKFLSFEDMCNTSQSCNRSRLEFRELTRFFTELSVCDYFFVPYKQSTVAMASLLTAIDVFAAGHRRQELPNDPDFRRTFQERIHFYTGLNAFTREVQECQRRLLQAYNRREISREDQDVEQQRQEEGEEEDSRLKQHQQQQAQPMTEQQQHHTEQEMSTIPSPVCVSTVPNEEDDDDELV
eukprot:CAMPEP_0203676286 /NCGR_PEP_ID=MMETSP0090-20130426/24165_1 /ASSEMBLY_ACC=CAM_ASM_001088 /TAXON_ID=426623 /ORGANISM="Chaetoceros affinis, Strain CCMP159" /LENGTH=363 /DNA_ID=CAMNT_0050542801 /DNA_START=557 /DNA_END=1648 /DNA_ORIENTATION=+